MSDIHLYMCTFLLMATSILQMHYGQIRSMTTFGIIEDFVFSSSNEYQNTVVSCHGFVKQYSFVDLHN